MPKFGAPWGTRANNVRLGSNGSSFTILRSTKKPAVAADNMRYSFGANSSAIPSNVFTNFVTSRLYTHWNPAGAGASCTVRPPLRLRVGERQTRRPAHSPTPGFTARG